jgi:nucleoid DNA-binding protein
MKKKELIVAVREELLLKGQRFSEKNIEDILDQTLEVIRTSVKEKKTINLPNFGRFKSKIFKARTCYSPKTKEYVELPDRTRPIFIPSTDFQELLKENAN